MQLSLVSIKVPFGPSLEMGSSFGKHLQKPQQDEVLNPIPQSPATVKMTFVFCYHHSLSHLSAGEAAHSFTENKHLWNRTVTNYSSCSIRDCKCLAPAVLSANPLNDWHLNIIPSLTLLPWLGCSCSSQTLIPSAQVQQTPASIRVSNKDICYEIYCELEASPGPQTPVLALFGKAQGHTRSSGFQAEVPEYCHRFVCAPRTVK